MKVTLAGPDDLGYWFLHDENGHAYPLVVTHEDHPMAAALFGWIESDDCDEDERIENARIWLMECIGDEIDAPSHVQKFFLELNGDE